MKRLSLVLGALLVVTATLQGAALFTQAPAATQYEYLRVLPVEMDFPVTPTSIRQSTGYRACVAGRSEWTCREFPPTESSEAALRTTLATLGTEGWELVSVVDDSETHSGLTYLFKRPLL